MEKTWKLYILRCSDGSLYTGITVDVEARFAQHSSGTGAKYTRGRGPLELVYVEQCRDHSHALKREYQVKSLSKNDKLALIQSVKEK
jgi:putative endonuclease